MSIGNFNGVDQNVFKLINISSNSKTFGTWSSSLFDVFRWKGSDWSTSQIGNSVRCHECEGFKHYQAECATYLKRKKKGLVITLFDKKTSTDNDYKDFGRALISCEQEEKIIMTDSKLSSISAEKCELDSEVLPISLEKVAMVSSSNLENFIFMEGRLRSVETLTWSYFKLMWR